MTMPYSPSRAVYEGNDAATRFPFSFKVWDASQLVVTLTSPDGATTEASGWTADIGASGGEIVYLHKAAPLPAGWKLAVTRNMPFTQEVNLVSASRFDPQVIEDALDQATAERQQTLEMMRRAVILPATSDKSPQDMVLDVYAARDEAQNASGAAQAAKAEAAAAVTTATAQADRAQGAANAAQAAADAAADEARQAVATELNRASSEADRAQSEADRAQMEANRAQNLANVGPADADKLGFVKIGKGIAVTDDGTIFVPAIPSPWDIFPPYVPIPVWGVAFGGSDGRRAIMPGETEPREDWIRCDGGSDGNGGGVPDMTGRVLLGANASYTAGTTGGTATHAHTISGYVGNTTLSIDQLAAHAHTTSRGNNTGDNRPYYQGAGTYQGEISTYGTGSSAGHSHTVNVNTAAVSNMQPFCAMHYIIKI